MMSAVAEIDNYRLNLKRYVSVRTIITCRYIQNNNAGIKVDVNLLWKHCILIMIYAQRFQTQCSSIKIYVYSYIYICTTEIAGYMYNTGADPGFQVRGGTLKKNCAERREARNFLGYFVWKITILRQKIIFFPILGASAPKI